MQEPNPQRTERKLKGNQILELSDADCAWLVESGQVALFGVRRSADNLEGSRRFLFSSGPGEALFGFEPLNDTDRVDVIAVALEDSALRRVPLDSLHAAAGGSDRRGLELIRFWVRRWQSSLAAPELAGPDFTLRALDDYLLQGLPELQRKLRERLNLVERREARSFGRRLRERERHTQEKTGDAVGRLAAVLQPDVERTPHGSDLFVAAWTVAREVGIKLRAPAAWEDQGADSVSIETIARGSHVRVRNVLLEDDWWQRDGGALLAFTESDRHPVALLPLSPTSYQLYDPANRQRRTVDEETAAGLDPQAWIFYRPLPQEATRGLTLLKFALHGRSRDLLVVLLTGIGATLLGMLTPQATALLVDHAIPNSDRGLLRNIGIGLIAAVFGAALFRLSQGIAMIRIETMANVATQSAVWDRLLNLQLAFFRNFSTGDLQSRVSAISQIRNYLSGSTLRTLFSSVILMLNLGLLLYYSPRLTLVALVVAVVSAALTIASGVAILRCVRPILELKGKFFGLMVQLITGVAKLRVAAAEERAFARWAEEYSRLLSLELRKRRVEDTVAVCNMGISTLSSVALFGVAASMAQGGPAAGGLSTGMFLAFLVAYGTFIGAISSLSNTVTDVLSIAILRERAEPILSAEPEVNELKADPGRLDGRVDLEHVVFRYREGGPIILNDVSIHVEAGQFVAFVGPSGSGKSTLFRLLLGFETPQSGGVFLEGQDLAGLDVYAMRRQMGVVLQNGRINAGSLFENIVGGTRASLNDAWEAARSTGFAEEIESMPMGMHTVISEGGTNLSGGQRQRLLIARALVHEPRILLLDEATSALDNRTQAIVSESLERLSVTRLVVAHRLSTIRKADRIYVIDSGRVVQQGTFDDLASQDGLFARLIRRQTT